MKPLMIFNDEHVPEEEASQYRHRRATRAVIVDNNGNVAILHQIPDDWYGIPGGGVEDGETYEQGVVRECKEEIGCDIKIEKFLGATIEYRKMDNLINESHGYTARIIGEKGSPNADDDTNDSIILWVPICEAMSLIKNLQKSENLYYQYCMERDLIFLKQALQENNQ